MSYLQQVKANHQRSGGLNQVIDVYTSKWEDINMHFVVGFPQTWRQNDSISVIVDRLTKFAHIIPITMTYLAGKYSKF